MPARETVAGVAVRRWLISNSRRMCGVREMRSLLASVKICPGNQIINISKSEDQNRINGSSTTNSYSH